MMSNCIESGNKPPDVNESKSQEKNPVSYGITSLGVESLPQKKPSKIKYDKRVISAALLITFFATMVNGIINPIIPEIKKTLNLSGFQSSSIIIIVPFIGIITSPLIGYVVDKYNCRNIILTIVITLISIAGGISQFTTNFVMLIILRGVQGLCGCLIALAITIIVEMFSTNKEQRSEWMAINSAMLTFGFSVNPVIGGFLGSVSWRYSFTIFWSGIPLAIFVYLILPVRSSGIISQSNYKFSELWKILLTFRSFATYISVIIDYFIVYSVVLYAFPILLANTLQASSLIISLYLAIGAVVTTSITLLHSRLIMNVDFPWLYTTGILTMGLGYLVVIIPSYFLRVFNIEITDVTSAWIISGGCIIFGLGEGLSIPALTSGITLLPHFDVKYKSTLMNLLVTTARIGQMMGPIFSAIIDKYYNNTFSILLAGSFGIISMLILQMLYLVEYLTLKSHI